MISLNFGIVIFFIKYFMIRSLLRFVVCLKDFFFLFINLEILRFFFYLFDFDML